MLPRNNAAKDAIKDKVFDMLQRAYADQGGIAGTGFNSPDDMVQNIPFWKINRKNGVINAVVMYKDTLGRKRVAMATDGTQAGKDAMADIIVSDMTQGRSYGEISGKALSFALRVIDVVPYLISFNRVQEIIAKRGDTITRPPADDPEIIRHPELADYFYVRLIGKDPHTKVMLGKPGMSLY
jgi:hypothetical protein